MTEVKSKKLRPEDWVANQNPLEVNLGFDTGRRSVVGWDISKSKNLLLAGYGVRQTEWELAAITRHASHHKIPVYGQDFSSFTGHLPKGTFKKFTADPNRAKEMLDELAEHADQHMLVIAGLHHLLAPTYVPEALREAEPERRRELIEALLKELSNPASHVVIVASKLHEESALPALLLESFPTLVLTSKIFARDLKHLLRAGQDAEAVSGVVHEMNAGNSVLLSDSVQEFENFRPGR